MKHLKSYKLFENTENLKCDCPVCEWDPMKRRDSSNLSSDERWYSLRPHQHIYYDDMNTRTRIVSLISSTFVSLGSYDSGYLFDVLKRSPPRMSKEKASEIVETLENISLDLGDDGFSLSLSIIFGGGFRDGLSLREIKIRFGDLSKMDKLTRISNNNLIYHVFASAQKISLEVTKSVTKLSYEEFDIKSVISNVERVCNYMKIEGYPNNLVTLSTQDKKKAFLGQTPHVFSSIKELSSRIKSWWKFPLKSIFEVDIDFIMI